MERLRRSLGHEPPLRRRLRPAYTAAQLAAVYDHGYDHTRWPDHVQRVEATVDIAVRQFAAEGIDSIADLSAGDGAIPLRLAAAFEARHGVAPRLHLGDLTTRWTFCGPIEVTLAALAAQVGRVELFVLSETLEHLDAPDDVLGRLRPLARRLLLSTPISELDASNPEHYWGWNIPAVRGMLLGAGWLPLSVDTVTTVPAYYDYQVWTAA